MNWLLKRVSVCASNDGGQLDHYLGPTMRPFVTSTESINRSLAVLLEVEVASALSFVAMSSEKKLEDDSD